MVALNPAFIDIDLASEGDRLGYPKGNLQVDPDVYKTCRSYGDVVELIPESQWRQLYEEKKLAKAENARLIKWILNQLSEGSCVGQMETQMMQYLHARAFGLDRVVQLSACSAYKQIGSSPNSGANIFDALRKGQQVGILPLDTPENRQRFGNHVMPATGFRTPWPEGWTGTAKHFRFDEEYRIENRNQGFTALLRGDAIGVGRKGHSILYIDLVWDDANNRWLVLYVNSWGQWGIAAGNLEYGFGLDSSRLFESALDGAFVVRTPKLPPWEIEPIQAPVSAA